LRELDDAALVGIESGSDDAAAWSGAPSALRALFHEAHVWTALPLLAPAVPMPPRRRHEPLRKQAQVDAFAAIIAPIAARAHRVVDVGAGHGHLTRELAAHLGVPVVGLEREPALVGRARALADNANLFAAVDALEALGADVANGANGANNANNASVALGIADCLVGLHACGALGDAMVARVARGGASSLALVGCCLQKRREVARAPLSSLPAELAAALTLDIAVLGLSNFTTREDAVEASRADNAAARARRLALHKLLTDAGVALAPWAEIDGLNRRSAHAPLATLAARAFSVRGLPAPRARAIDDAERWAVDAWALSRRLGVPRVVLARVLEVFVLLDRAAALNERGLDVTVGLAFPMSASARNTVLLARRDLR
jgi:SAM-dependent methyltransferase